PAVQRTFARCAILWFQARKVPSVHLDSERFRFTPRTSRRFCSRLSVAGRRGSVVTRPIGVCWRCQKTRGGETHVRHPKTGNSLRFWLAWPLHGQGCLVLSHVFPELAYFGMPPTKRKKQFIWEQYAGD